MPVSEGIGIYQVTPNSAAAAAGLRGLEQTEDGDVMLGDIIVAIDGEKIADRDDLYRVLDKHQINDTIRVEIIREGQRTTVPVRLIPERRGILRR